jgi:hypothetical protein
MLRVDYGWAAPSLDLGHPRAVGLAVGPRPHRPGQGSAQTTDQLRTKAPKFSTRLRSTMDTNEMSFNAQRPLGPDLGVKGSRVQISPARQSEVPSQTAKLPLEVFLFHDRLRR